jgi:hypothetical protein
MEHGARSRGATEKEARSKRTAHALAHLSTHEAHDAATVRTTSRRRCGETDAALRENVCYLALACVLSCARRKPLLAQMSTLYPASISF